MKNQRPSKNKGTILILALLVMAMLEVVIIMIIEMQSFEVIHTQDLDTNIQDMQLLLGGEKWAIGQVARIKQLKLPPEEFYALPPTQTPDGLVVSTLMDAQSKININGFNAQNAEGLKNFLQNVLKRSDVGEVLTIMAPSASLLQLQNFNSREEEGEASPQSNALEALRTNRGRILAQIQGGMTAYLSPTEYLSDNLKSSDFKKLYPYLIALPAAPGVNLNTAPLEVLMSLSPDMNENLAQTLIDLRKNKVLDNDTSFNQNAALQNALKESPVAYQSTYYLSKASVIHEHYTLTLYSLLSMTENESYIDVQVLWRSLGTI